MPVCERHTRFIPEGQYCGACWSEGVLTKKVEEKQIKQKANKKPTDRSKLKDKLQRLVSKHMKAYYLKLGINYCFISGKSTNAKGMFSLHASHYFPKGELWQLWTVPENIGLSTYDMNVNKPQTVSMMRSKLVEIWGEDRIKKLEGKAEYHKKMMSIGAEKKHPPIEWLQAKIIELKSKNYIVK